MGGGISRGRQKGNQGILFMGKEEVGSDDSLEQKHQGASSGSAPNSPGFPQY